MKTKQALNAILLSLAAFSCATSTAFALDAYYTVPVEKSLQKYASFPLTSIEVTESKGKLTLQYALPEELTGVANQTIRFESDASPASATAPVELSGPNGSGSCQHTNPGLTCLVHMKDLQSDPVRLSALLKEQSSSSDEFNARSAVAARFESDPVGVVSYLY